ncbi:hypothetical protein IV73_GL000352 [Weissella kandleri]|uniref:HTH merR-type domain-containing protein n=1 Tax=Weissella kandleri TaxID=1616 RepID=A0A0R2JIE1_9LACO|nr:MerR family transcriptional regulator [Weissella kandleri]KRN74460.1 hypothetical protein IV73_GL000352 [Weissella kandleri]
MRYLIKKGYLKTGFDVSKYKFRIGEIEKMTGISARQLRYWESKGIIKPLERTDEQTGRVYPFNMFIKITMIKSFLAEGLTLKAAVARMKESQKYMIFTHDVISGAVQGLVEDGDRLLVDLGDFDEAGTQRLLAYQKEPGEHQRVSYVVVDKRTLESQYE